ncbi:MAG TPA: sigma-70 family RNA polymerase sigma factor [Actinomycetes bacterium]|nr:sigma-70 family RNA polymerase sigma factor [Actinomycetes bacterium]
MAQPPASWPQDEHTLHQRLLAGEEAALAALYDRFASLVHGLALRVTHDRAAAEDLTQDVFVWIWEHPEAFDPARGRLRAWIAMLTHRRAVDWVRHGEVRRRYAMVEAEPPPPVPGVEEEAVAAATAKCVRAALEDLPEAQQAVIRLTYFDGLTCRAAAEALGIPEGTAKSRLRLGLRRLADQLEAAGILDA